MTAPKGAPAAIDKGGQDVTVKPDGSFAVTVARRDYAANQAASIAALEADAAQLKLTGKEEDAVAADRIQAAANELKATPAPLVTRHVDIPLVHQLKRGKMHPFTATFDAVQRILTCPICGGEVPIPAEFCEAP